MKTAIKVIIGIVAMGMFMLVLSRGISTTSESHYEFYNVNEYINDECSYDNVNTKDNRDICIYNIVVRGARYISQPHNNDKYKAHYGVTDIEYAEDNEKYCTFCEKIAWYSTENRCISRCNEIRGTQND